ncbi:MAG: hypothetical protein Q9190_003484 [Brigantiaea leucoxantha]
MPKAGGRGGSSKKVAAPALSKEDDSYIVFGDSNPKKKAKDASTGTGSSAPTGEDTPKKPDTRQLIGGTSWTGKLPVNLLAEHCQKMKWAKPEYTMNKTPSGFTSSVILKTSDPKTRELLTLPPLTLPSSYRDIAIRPTALEARHFAATYTLFRVCSMRNIHMMLPPTYRDLWKKDFAESKAEDTRAGRGWMYEADPFLAKQEQDEARSARNKKQAEFEKQRSNEAKQPSNESLTPAGNSKGSAELGRRAWTNLPKVEMGKRTRAQIEDVLRQDTIWNPNAVRISEFQQRNIVREFVELGFRESHVREAISECKDREEALEWLLIYVPEDDLPAWSLPEGYTAGISMASGDLKREASIKRLTEAGYSADLCSKIFDALQGNEDIAAEALQLQVVDDSSLDPSEAETEVRNSSWDEEQDTLSAIFADRFSKSGPNMCEVQIQNLGLDIHCTLRVRKSQLYPHTCPVIAVLCPKLPAYIRLGIIWHTVQHARSNLLGEAMVFNIVDFLEAEVPKIIKNPGRLRQVSARVASASEAKSSPEELSLRQRKPRQIDRNLRDLDGTAIFDRWREKQNLPQQQRMLAVRQKLPAWSLKSTIVQTVNDHQVTIISGETGSGKSTQSVQFILDDMIQRGIGGTANIICTQPRRISALSLADRVSDERCSMVGDEIGYAIRGESKQRAGATRITFVTTGVLLRRLQTSSGSQNDIVAALADVSHIVVDEVHERSLDTDFLLILLKEVLSQHRDLKVVLMSATLDANIFEAYFNHSSTVGKIEIPGRTYPIADYYLDDVLEFTAFNPDSRASYDNDQDSDIKASSVANKIQSLGAKINYDLIAQTVQAIDSQYDGQDGGILVFLPGLVEITRTLEALKKIPNLYVLSLHASLLPNEQRRVFPPAPRGKRKVIATTNVAETSVTIEDIIAVIDSGKVKETSFDPQNNMVKLEEVWASRAACKQRRGRAGRVRSGVCYKLYTRSAEAKMAERPDPEIRRVPLEQLCLSVRAMGVADILKFLASALTPPETLAIEGAIDTLRRMGALDGSELTALGQHLSMIPADLRCGKLMIYGATFGCLESSLTTASILTVRSPFVSPQAKREESKASRTSFAPGQGDLICDLKAYEEWSNLKATSSFRDVRSWCDQHFLSSQTLSDISSTRIQYLSALQDAGFLPLNYSPSSHPSLNSHNSNTSLLRALVAGAFQPQIARIDFPDKKYAQSVSGAVEIDPEARTIKYFNQDHGRVFVHPSSTLFDAQVFPGNSVYLSYFNKMATSKVFIRELTPFNAYALLLFSGPITLDTLGRGLIVDGWLRLRGWARIGVLVSRLRIMLDGVLARKIERPEMELGGGEVVGIVRKLVELNGMDR